MSLLREGGGRMGGKEEVGWEGGRRGDMKVGRRGDMEVGGESCSSSVAVAPLRPNSCHQESHVKSE